MTAERKDITVEQGATLQESFLWEDEDGSPIDLTGYTARAQIRSSPTSTQVLYEFDSDDDTITLDSSGNIVLIISAADSANLSFNTAVYDLLLTSGDIVTRLVYGRVSLISPLVTR